MKFRVGSIYSVDHTRKGKFFVKVEKSDEEWTSGVIVSGTASAMMDYNVKEKGDEITFRNTLISAYSEIEYLSLLSV